MDQDLLPEVTDENLEALGEACIEGRTEDVRTLLNASRYSIHGMEKSYIDLYFINAAKLGYLDIMKALHDKGADINGMGYHRNPLGTAVSSGHLEVVRW